MNRLDLTQPHVHCHVLSEGPLPAAAYNVVATLAEAVETASAELDEILNAEE
jgi:hypothetical protein